MAKKLADWKPGGNKKSWGSRVAELNSLIWSLVPPKIIIDDKDKPKKEKKK